MIKLLWVVVVSVVLTCSHASYSAPSSQPVIDVPVQVISVPVTVLDRRGRFVDGLTLKDFVVSEDGVAQELTSFALQSSEISALLLLDVSGSMAGGLPAAKRAALQFVRQLGPNDRVSVMQFDETPTTLGPFTSDRTLIEAAVNQAKVGGATALYDAIWAGLAAIQAERKRSQDTLRRQVLVVLSDGDDSASAMTSEDILRRARSADTIVSALSLDSEGQSRSAQGSAAFLRQLADLSGGQLLFPGFSNLERAYRDLADELRRQYVLGYVPQESASVARYRRIDVKVANRNNLTLRHRQGYFTQP